MIFNIRSKFKKYIFGLSVNTADIFLHVLNQTSPEFLAKEFSFCIFTIFFCHIIRIFVYGMSQLRYRWKCNKIQILSFIFIRPFINLSFIICYTPCTVTQIEWMEVALFDEEVEPHTSCVHKYIPNIDVWKQWSQSLVILIHCI